MINLEYSQASQLLNSRISYDLEFNCIFYSWRRQSTRSVVLLFTDGQSNRNSAQTKQRALELKSIGAEIFTVSLDKEIDLEELNSIATSFQHVIQVIFNV